MKSRGKDRSHVLSLLGSKRLFSDREDQIPHREGCSYGLKNLQALFKKIFQLKPRSCISPERDILCSFAFISLLPKAT